MACSSAGVRGSHLSGEYSVATRNSDTTPFFSAVKEPRFSSDSFFDPSPVFVPVLMRELGNSQRGVSEGGA